MGEAFKYLFSPITFRSVTIPNRIVFPPHGSRFVDRQTGYAIQQQADYFAERARGGVGLIVMGGTMVHQTGLCMPNLNTLADDGAIPGLRMIADAVHQYDTKIFGQLSHLGRQGTTWASGRALWAPSAIACNLQREMPHQMDEDDIEELIAAYPKAARRVLEAGFDGIELYLAHGYLLCEFLSAYSNRRTDQYGGSLENRFRLVARIIDVLRNEIGEDVPMGVRMSADEFVPTGLTLEETRPIAQMVEATGKTDYLQISQCNYDTIYLMIPEMSFPPAAFTYLCAGIKEVVDLPVMAVARINDPILAERILAEGQADMICMCRALIADPELPTKAREGRLEEIRACIACNVGCRGGPMRGLNVMCLQNPAVGYERELGIGTAKPAAIKKKVMVVGGGPGGLKAAKVAAERGHQVSLYEKSERLGGQVLIAAKAPTRDELAGSVRYLAKQLERLGVRIHLGVTVTPELVAEVAPDAVIVATGSVPQRPAIPGADQPNVLDPWQVLDQEIDTGQRVLVSNVGGEADWKFCTTADFLAGRGKKVEMVTQLSDVAADLDPYTKTPTLKRLKANKVVTTPYTRIKEIAGRTVTLVDVWTGEERQVEGVDSVVFAWYNKANDDLYYALKGKVAELYAVGDCVAPRKAIDAIREGFRAGRQV